MLTSAIPKPAFGVAVRADGLLDAILALSIILAGASRFRIEGFPLGPGEAGLMAWIGLRLASEILWPSPFGRSARVIALFWVVFAGAQCLGLMRSMAIDTLIDWPSVLHDIAAFAVVASLSTLLLILPHASLRLLRITRYMMMFGCVSLACQVVSAWGVLELPGVDPWYWDRFRGWADNPNQLALFCAILVPIAVYGIETGRSVADRWAATGCASAALVAGLLTKSNSLTLGLAVGASFGGAMIVKRTLWPGPGQSSRTALPLAFVFAFLPVFLVSAVPYLSTFEAESIAEQVARDSSETANEAALRFELWSEAIGQGRDSLYLGLGPGPHARIPLELVVRQRWEPGANDPSLGDVAKHGAVMESHNTYVELFSQGGIVIVLAYLFLLAYGLRRSFTARSIALPALLCVIVVFGAFHVVFRHPIVWFGICLCLGSAEVEIQKRSPKLSLAERTTA